ncbi:MAG TPA: ABC transporter permease [Burkholderiales bacterium]|nr:ABC transporter permease [Burkholderiales bacterium]
MTGYLVRRILYAIPILIGVNLITFALFFFVNTPDDMARLALGGKRVTEEAVEKWKRDKGYDKPHFYNAEEAGLSRFTSTIFFTKSASMFVLDFGVADDGRDIAQEVRTRMWPSLAIAAPTFFVGFAFYITFALVLAFFRATYVDVTGVIVCVAAMSISSLFYIIGGQYLISKLWHLVPISGFGDGVGAFKFLALPIAIGIVSSVGANARWYRTIFIEEINKEYVRTARAKGLSESRVLFRHVLHNAMIPILTGVVVIIPGLFLGSLIMESFFSIPGLGSYTIEAINNQDYGIVRAMVFLGSILYIIGLILTDVAYTLVDPRVRLD